MSAAEPASPALTPQAAAARPGYAQVAAARRRLATVLIDGLGPLGLRTAEHLLPLGLAAIAVHDRRPVTGADLTAGYRSTQLARPRAESAAVMLAAQSPRTPVVARARPSAAGADLHVSTEAADVVVLSRIISDGTCALPATVGPQGLRIGPLISAETDWCAQCLDRHGLLDGAGELDPGDPLTALAAAALAHQIQLLVDGVPAAVQDHVLLCARDQAALSAQPIQPHPECDCLLTVSV